MTEANSRERDREAFTDHMTAYHQSLGKDFWLLLWPAVQDLAAGKPGEPRRLAALANLPLDRTLATARELPVMLGKPARIQSSCAATGHPHPRPCHPHRRRKRPPRSPVVSFPDAPFGDLAKVTQTGCNEANFCRDAEAASEWLTANPHGRLAAVPDAFEVLRTAMLRIKEWFERPTG